MKERSALRRDPSITEMSTEEAIDFLMRVYGEDEATARLMVGVAKDELEGDAFGIADDADVSSRPRPPSGNVRAS